MPTHGFPALVAILALCATSALAARPLLPSVEIEEGIYTYAPADNGAGPLWCYGSTCLARIGNDVFASGLETLPDQKPLNNCRWTLYKRTATGWQLQQADPKGRTREPCPIGAFPDGRLFLSVNPTLTEPGTYNGPAQPQILEFSAANPKAPYKTLVPTWAEKPPFTEHSYRGFCVDGPSRGALLFNILGYDTDFYTLLDKSGTFVTSGKLSFPMGVDYEVPEPIRLCYPVLALRNRAAHVLAISDIIEPVKAWREYKLKLHNGNTWDYDFRRLFYAWTPDVAKQPFSQWIEIASREKTAGYISNRDIWLDKQGRAHLLWLDSSIWDLRMRDKFFPGVPSTQSLEYAIIDRGQIVQRSQLAIGGEGQSSLTPGTARLHATPDGRLFAFYYCSGADAKGQAVSENRLMEILPDGTHGDPVRVPLEHPFTNFMTATERGGSPPSNTLEVLGEAIDRPGISYARINLTNAMIADFAWAVQRTAAGSRVTLDGTPSVSAGGKVTSWQWDVGGVKATGPKAAATVAHGGTVTVALTARDDQGNVRKIARTIALLPASSDFGLKQWGLIVRTEAEGFCAEGGWGKDTGPVHVRNDKLNASGESLSHWNAKGHWLEWDLDIPREDDYYLLARYATPENATRALTIDGQAQLAFRFPKSGGYGTASVDNWAYASLTGATGKPLAIHLTAGAHKVRLENPDGTGLNLDYLDWIAHSAAFDPVDKSAGIPVDENGYRYLLPAQGTIVPSHINAEIGFCYTTSVGSRYPGDGIKDGPASTLRLFEDGKESGPAHSVHVDIRTKGEGRFSHWVTMIYFSASDNSDPRTNGRRYTWRLEAK